MPEKDNLKLRGVVILSRSHNQRQMRQESQILAPYIFPRARCLPRSAEPTWYHFTDFHLMGLKGSFCSSYTISISAFLGNLILMLVPYPCPTSNNYSKQYFLIVSPNFYSFQYWFLYSCSQTIYRILCYMSNTQYTWPKQACPPGDMWEHVGWFPLPKPSRKVCWPTGEGQGGCEISCSVQDKPLDPTEALPDPKCQWRGSWKTLLYFVQLILLHI